MPYSFNPFTGNFDNTPSTLKGDNAYTNVNANSASYATINFTNGKFFPLSGGIISGTTRINGNVTIFGDLSSTGTQTFANTIFATTSSLSVVHVGSGPAVWVGNNGFGDIASFYDIDQGVEVFHIGGANGTFPNVGVNTSSPNKDFTVNGEISATSDIWTSGRILSGGQELASIFRPDIDKGLSVFNTVQSNSASNWNYQGTDLKSLSANWQNAYTDYSSSSASYATSNFVQSNFLPLTGGIISGALEAGTGSVTLFISGNRIGINTELPNQDLTVVGNISATGVISASASNIKVNVISDSTSRIFTDADNNKVVHIDTTTTALCAIFPSSLSNGFNVAIMNTGTNGLVLSAAQLNAVGNVITVRYGGAFVYKDSDNLFAVGRLV